MAVCAQQVGLAVEDAEGHVEDHGVAHRACTHADAVQVCIALAAAHTLADGSQRQDAAHGTTGIAAAALLGLHREAPNTNIDSTARLLRQPHVRRLQVRRVCSR